MKKTLFKKLFWQSLLSTLVLSIFIWLALGSTQAPAPGDAFHKIEYLGEGIYQDSTGFVDPLGQNVTNQIITGHQDNFGHWTGPVVIKNHLSGSYEEVDMFGGYRHGKSKTTFKNGQVVFNCYNWNNIIPCGNAANIGIRGSSAFQILSYKYPWFLYSLNSLGFDNEYVEAYMDKLETVMNSYEYNEEEVGNYYDDATMELEETPYDSIIQINSVLTYFNGLDLAKNAEFRLAVIDRFWADEASTFNSVKATYPGYLVFLNDYFGVNEQDFEGFSQDFDSLLVSYGTLDSEDPFFVDSLDIRMIRALEYIYSIEDTTESAMLSLNSADLFYVNNKIGSNLNKINPKQKSILLDASPQQVAESVIFTILLHYVEGEIIKLAAMEAYKAKHGLINLPIVTTEFISNNSSTSATVRGYVIEEGSSEVTNRGIAWATTYNPTIENQFVTSGAGLGEYSVTISDLTPGTTYYARSYATNSDSTTYGNCVKFNSATTSIFENELSQRNFTVYPNPASDNVTFRFEVEQFGKFVLTIINVKGQVVIQKELDKIFQGENKISLNISNLENGLYICKLTNKGAIKATGKFLINH